MNMGFDSAFLIGVACGAVVYLVSRWAVGRHAEAFIGGCIVAGAVFQPWWASASGYLAGHAIAAILVGEFLNHARPRPYLLGVLLVAIICPLAGFYSTALSAISEGDGIAAKALKRYEAGSDVERFVAQHYAPCLERRVSGPATFDNGKDLPTVCKAAALTIASKVKGEEFAKQAADAMNRWDSDRFGDEADRARIDKALKPISG